MHKYGPLTSAFDRGLCFFMSTLVAIQPVNFRMGLRAYVSKSVRFPSSCLSNLVFATLTHAPDCKC